MNHDDKFVLWLKVRARWIEVSDRELSIIDSSGGRHLESQNRLQQLNLLQRLNSIETAVWKRDPVEWCSVKRITTVKRRFDELIKLKFWNQSDWIWEWNAVSRSRSVMLRNSVVTRILRMGGGWRRWFRPKISRLGVNFGWRNSGPEASHWGQENQSEWSNGAEGESPLCDDYCYMVMVAVNGTQVKCSIDALCAVTKSGLLVSIS